MIYLWLTTYLFMKELNHSEVRVSLNRTTWNQHHETILTTKKWLDLSCFTVPMFRVNMFETTKQVDHTGTKYKHDEAIRFLTSPVNFQHTQGYTRLLISQVLNQLSLIEIFDNIPLTQNEFFWWIPCLPKNIILTTTRSAGLRAIDYTIVLAAWCLEDVLWSFFKSSSLSLL